MSLKIGRISLKLGSFSEVFWLFWVHCICMNFRNELSISTKKKEAARTLLGILFNLYINLGSINTLILSFQIYKHSINFSICLGLKFHSAKFYSCIVEVLHIFCCIYP